MGLLRASVLDAFHTSQQFDAVVGRFVLLYMPDAAATIQHLLRFVRPDLLPLGTLAERLEAEAVRANSQVMASVQYGAWTRKPV